MQPAINVHSPRSGTQAAPAVNTVSAATGPFVSQQPPVVSATDTHHQQPQAGWRADYFASAAFFSLFVTNNRV